MGCNCGKKEKVIQNPKTVKLVTVDEREPTKEEINLVDDWYNNLDTIEPLPILRSNYPDTPDGQLAYELDLWNKNNIEWEK
jgi:hypothetical protein